MNTGATITAPSAKTSSTAPAAENAAPWFDASIAASAAKTKHTWTGRNWFWFTVQAFTVQRFLARHADDVLEISVDHRGTFEIESNRNESFIVEGSVAYSIRGHLVACEMDSGGHAVTLSAKRDMKGLIAQLEAELKHRNPLRGHHVQIVPTDGGFRAAIRAVPSTRFSDVILDANLQEDLYDNTIFQLKATRMSNGLIFHGPPGTGKSLACQAVAHDAVAEGFSSVFATGEVDFTMLGEFLGEFLTPCVMIFEDVDCFAGERVDGNASRNLSDFLQFLSGVTERKEQMIVIATTNHLDRLDKAVQERPVRFNRKYHFGRPDNADMDRLLDLQFGAGTLTPELKRLCHDQDYSGAYVTELKRTAITLAHKRGKPEREVFAEAVETVARHFGVARKSVGFAAVQ